ncbi:TonB-dependent receptor domain-containing protein [Ferrimonas futtsuensis]|uniref:TonB-dependent receptor domain-containing protein n=1 Tax=Ferrimonas futtsuensis TaxID=364764 RepID=UPI000484C68A|nr:TonB-dependent receptor [Ferrimonas futtsuensis]
MKRSVVSRAVVSGLFTTLITATLTSGVATATEAEIERITVLGTRIAREGTLTPTPVTVVTGESLINTGAVNIAEALNELPALASSGALASSTVDVGGGGLSVLDLRGMGSERTLVLVDGKRHVSSSVGDSRVDINTIPLEWVESVEIITGGASAIYGADAVTGVVNFRLKRDLQGLTLRAIAGSADDSDFNTRKFSLSYGQDFDDGRGNAALSLEYAGQSKLGALDREATEDSWTTMTGTDTVERWVQGGYYGVNNAGVVFGPWHGLGDSYTFADDGSLVTIDTGDEAEGLKCGASCNYYENLRQWETLQPKLDSVTANFKGHYGLGDEMEAYLEAKWSRTDAHYAGPPAFFLGNLQLQRDNAFIGADLGQLMDQNGLGSIMLNRFLNDLGPRSEENERTVQRYVLGVKGELVDGWELDAFGLFGQSDLRRENGNNLVNSRFAKAVDSVLVDGEAVCRSEADRAEGCVALNLFGEGSITPEMRDYISTTSVMNAVLQQTVLGASVTNPAWFALPAGEAGFAAGAEYRKESMKTREDELAASGDTFFPAYANEDAHYDVSEVYAELSLPLVADQPGVESLEMDLAARYSNYSSSGDTTSWKLGLSWVPVKDLRVRTTLSSAFRAPSLGEFAGAEKDGYYPINDSCKASRLAELTEEQRAIRAGNCASLGVPADFDSDYDTVDLKGVESGNDKLEPEESRSFTAGLVYQPGFIDSLTLTLDYWDIEITDAIAKVGAQKIIDRCLDNPTGTDNPYCDLLSRDPVTHELTHLVNTYTNVAKQEASGVDFEIGYDTALGEGDLSTSLVGTYLIGRNEYAFQDDPAVKEEFAGTPDYAKWQANLITTYSLSDWGVAWTLRYMDGVDVYTPQFNDDFTKPYSTIMSYGTYVVNDVLMHYTWDNGVRLGLGVDNLFDRDLPGHSMGNVTGMAGYDNVGRFYYLTFDYSL